MEYVPGDPNLIKNIVTQLKSQGIFDQFRKECIADVDTKPAYQNLCHLADTQVSKFLSKVKWAPDLHKNQIRENIRKHVNECNFVEPGIAIIVDQLVNPRINTVLVPKVEEMLYKYLGIPIPECVTSRKEVKPFNHRQSSRDKTDSSVDSNFTSGNTDKKKDIEKSNANSITRSHESNKYDGSKNENKFSNVKNDSATNKVQSNDKNYRDLKPPGIKSEPMDNSFGHAETEKTESKIELKEELIQSVAMDMESSDDEISPPYEPHEKSDDMSLDSGDSNYSEIIDVKRTESGEPDIPGFEPPMEIAVHEDTKPIPHEDSLDSVPAQSPVPEKISISPLEIPKTPTINYETSDDSDDYIKNKNASNTGLSVDTGVRDDEIPDVNFDKIVEKVIEDNADEVAKRLGETNVQKEDEGKSKDKSVEEAKKKYKHKDEKSKSADGKDKHGERKHEHRSDKDKSKHDKHRSDRKPKEGDKEKSKHDKNYKKDDRSHHSKDRDRSKSEHESKSKSESKKDDKEHKKDDKEHKKSDHKKDDKSEHKKDDKHHRKDSKSSHRKDDKSERRKEDDKKHRDDNRKKDAGKSDDRKPKKSDDSKHKHDDKKTKDAKRKDEEKKNRTQCNTEEKKKTDRRSSDRDSSGPSASNSSLPGSHSHSSKTDKDKGSSKHKHSSSSHKSKKNDVAKSLDKDSDDKMNEDDLEMILECSPEKAYQRPVRDDFAKLPPPASAGVESKDNIEDMMSKLFMPSKPNESNVPKVSLVDGTEVILKKPKIAKNFADIRRIMKLRKLYEDSFELKDQAKDTLGSSVEPLDGQKEARLRKTVEYFVKRRFGKNGSNADKCLELTNAIIDTLTGVKLNITRVDRKYSIINGSCSLNDEQKIYDTISDSASISLNDDLKKIVDMEHIPDILNDETTNLVLDDLAKSYVNHEFKLDNLSVSSEDEKIPKSDPAEPEEKLKLATARKTETKANGAKKKLPIMKEHLSSENASAEDKRCDPQDDTSPSLKLKFKSTFDGKNKTWHTLDESEPIEDPVHYLPPPSPNEAFRKCAADMIENALNIEVDNLVVELEYPECYDAIFQSQLGAKVIRKRVPNAVSSPTKYNFEIITKNADDKTITLRIKKSSEMNEPSESKKMKKRKIDGDPSTLNDCMNTQGENKKVPVKRKSEGAKRKTLGIKRSLLSASMESPNTLKLFNTSQSTDPNDMNVKKVVKVNKPKDGTITNNNHNRSESESSDGRRSSVSSTGNNTHIKGINDVNATPAATKTKTKNSMANDSKAESPSELNTTNVATTTKSTDPPKRVLSLEEKRKQTIMNCYYDESDLYKPRPSYRLTSRRYRLGNTDNT